jgi:hypothetical protein
MDAVHCQACGAELNEDRALLPEQRSPCPECGSMARRFTVELAGTIQAASHLTATATIIRTVAHDAILTDGGAASDSIQVGRTASGNGRVVDETDTVVRAIRWTPLENGRRLAIVEDENGTILDVGAGETPEDTAVELIVSEALLPPNDDKH